MRARMVRKIWVFATMGVAVAALAFVLMRAPEILGSLQDPEMMSMDPAASNFIASGGLVPDSPPQVPSTDEPTSHAEVAAQGRTGTTRF